MPYLPKPRRKRYKPARTRRPTGDQSFYNSSAWRTATARYRQQHPLCEVSEAAGLVVAADVTDHIISRSFGGSDFDPRNLMALCKAVHDRKSGMETQGAFLKHKRTAQGLIPASREEIHGILDPLGQAGGGGSGLTAERHNIPRLTSPTHEPKKP